MASVPRSPADRSRVDNSGTLRELRVSTFDEVSGMLIALLMTIGFIFMVLLAIWITSQVWFNPKPPPMVLLPEPEPGGGGNGASAMNELEEPMPEEIEQTDETPPEIVLEAVTDLASLTAAVVDDLKPMAQGRGQGRGTGDGRGKGSGGDGDADIIPRWERWVIKYASDSTEAYARQLDFFGIELGAVGGPAGGQNVDYAAGLSTGSPRRRSGPADQEKRLYLTWRSGDLARADIELLGAAGIPTQGRITMQLYPPEVEAMLQTLERERSGGRDVRGILKTIFGVRAIAGGRYEYHVMDQYYRTFQQ